MPPLPVPLSTSTADATISTMVTEPLSELTLSEIWQAQWLSDDLRTVDGRALRVVYRGVWTHGLGPDFAGALLDLDGRLVDGDVEIHLRASGWREHGHQLDAAYNRVVLHVVWSDDLPEPVRRQDGRLVATLCLADCLPDGSDAFNPSSMARPLGSIGFDHCAPRVADEHPAAIQRVWERAGDERMAGKVARVAQALSVEPPSQVLYALLLDSMGYTRNREGMRAVASHLHWDHLDARLVGQPVSVRWGRAAGLLLGIGGFLPLSPREAELAALDPVQVEAIERAWQRHGAAWQAVTLAPTAWSLTRQRPSGHPLRRLLALSSLLARLRVGLIEDLCSLLVDQHAEAYRALIAWLSRDNRYLGAAHAHEVVVNVVVPFALAYGDESGDTRLAAAAADLWDQAPAGRGNAVARRTAEQICGPSRVSIGGARAEQGLLHLHATGCSVMRCYECPIAHMALESPR